MLMDSGLYVPTFINEDGLTQPLATALWLDAGKHLCQQHFLKRCRTVMHLPGRTAEGQQNTTLEWRQLDSGVYEGQPQDGLSAPLAFLASTLYRLQPTE